MAGFVTAAGGRPQRDENVLADRLGSALAAVTGKAERRGLAEAAMRYLASPQIAPLPQTGGVLLADLELPAR